MKGKYSFNFCFYNHFSRRFFISLYNSFFFFFIYSCIFWYIIFIILNITFKLFYCCFCTDRGIKNHTFFMALLVVNFVYKMNNSYSFITCVVGVYVLKGKEKAAYNFHRSWKHLIKLDCNQYTEDPLQMRAP